MENFLQWEKRLEDWNLEYFKSNFENGQVIIIKSSPIHWLSGLPYCSFLGGGTLSHITNLFLLRCRLPSSHLRETGKQGGWVRYVLRSPFLCCYSLTTPASNSEVTTPQMVGPDQSSNIFFGQGQVRVHHQTYLPCQIVAVCHKVTVVT